MQRSYKIILPLALYFLFSVTFFAQDDFREKIEEVKLEKLTKKLELDVKTKETFIEKYKSFSKTMRSLNLKRVKTYKLMTENIESGNGLDTLVNQLIDNESEINQKRVDFVTDMKSILTSQQIAKMIVFERKFNNEIKKLLKQYQKDNRNENPFKED